MPTRTSSMQRAPSISRPLRMGRRIVFVSPHPLTRQHARSWGLLVALARSERYSLTALALCRTAAEIAETISLRRLGIETLALPDDTPPGADEAAYDSAPQLRAILGRIIARGDVALAHIEGERLAPLVRDLAVPVVWDIAENTGILRRLTARGLRAIGDSYEMEALRACARVIVADRPAAVALAAAQRRAMRSHLTLLPIIYPTPFPPPLSPNSQHSPVSLSSVRHNPSGFQMAGATATRSSDPQVCVIPNGLTVNDEPPDAQPRDRRAGLLITGDLGAEVWVRGITWFLRDVAPGLWRLYPDFPITLVAWPGSAVSLALRARVAVAQRASGGRIHLVEDATDIRPYVQQTALAVIPLAPDARPVGVELSQAQASALATMACGVPTVLTQPALAGLLAAPGRDLLVATSGERLRTLIARVLEDRELWGLLARNGQMYVERRHSWRQSAALLEGVYERILLGAAPTEVAAHEDTAESAAADWRGEEDGDAGANWANPSVTHPLHVGAILAELHAHDAASEASQSQWNFAGVIKAPLASPVTGFARPADPLSLRRLSRWR